MSIVDNQSGFSVRSDADLYRFAASKVKEHAEQLFQRRFSDLTQFISLATDSAHFDMVKVKASRIFPANLAADFVEYLRTSKIADEIGNDFQVSDEEALGYPNFYWRLVRANSDSDVGSLHADEWFWILNKQSIPPATRRIKVWMPLAQDDDNPSLLIVPGSHVADYRYTYSEDHVGKRRPIIDCTIDPAHIFPAPVGVGQQIIFHDRMIHGGRSTTVHRVSIEFTLIVPSTLS